MSVMMSIYLYDAILMGADSRLTKRDGLQSDTANKVFVSKNHVGICTTGNRSIEGHDIEPYINRFLKNHENSSVTEMANSVLKYFLDLCEDLDSIFLVAGYEKDLDGELKQKKFRVSTKSKSVVECTYETGAQWNGVSEYITKLLQQTYTKSGDDYLADAHYFIDWDHMTIQQGVDAIRFFIKTTEQMMHFHNRLQSVGGNIDILMLTPEGHTWINKKQIQ